MAIRVIGKNTPQEVNLLICIMLIHSYKWSDVVLGLISFLEDSTDESLLA